MNTHSTRQRVAATLTLFLPTLLLLQSCEKAPATGEAFITLKSNEVRPLADTEIMFFGSGFVTKFEEFKKNLVNETRAKVTSLLNQKLSEAERELSTFEATRANVLQKAKDAAIEEFGQQRAEAQAEFERVQREISESEPLIQKIEKNFSTYFDAEEALAITADEIRAGANKISEELITKINAAIVAEQIPVPKLPLDAKSLRADYGDVNQEQPKHRRLTKMISDWRSSPDNFDELIGISQWLADVEENEYIKDAEAFVLEVTQRSRVADLNFDQGTCAKNIPRALENSKVADQIRSTMKTLQDHKNEVVSLDHQVANNHKALKQAFQVFANAENMEVDSIDNLISRRDELRSKAEQAKLVLKQTEKGSVAFNSAAEQAVNAAQLEFDKNADRLRQRVSQLKTQASELSASSGSSIPDFEGQQDDIVQLTIASFLKDQQLSSTRTGSDGKFAVPPKARYASAFLKREAPEEELFWLVKINLEDTSLKLTNSNITKASWRRAKMGALDCKL